MRKPTGSAQLQEDVTEAIKKAALEELADRGYGRLSMEAIAQRAGVGKAALYRRWPCKQDMLIDLIAEMNLEVGPVPDMGSLHEELRFYFENVYSILMHPLTSNILPDMYAEMMRNPELRQRVREGIQERKKSKALEIIKRAIARGEVTPDVDLELALDFMVGPAYWRLNVLRDPIPENYLDKLTKMVVAALKA